MGTLELLGSTLGLGFLSGVRLYATVVALGLGIRFGWITLPDRLAELNILADWRVLSVAGIVYLIEFFADKIPWLDSAWDSVHTFIRPLGAAAIATAALSSLDPAWKASLILVTGGVALAGHSSKAATRLAVNHSPEPFSNIALSVAEDLFVPFGVWMAVEHPLISLGIVAGFVVFFAWISPKIFRLVRLEGAALWSAIAGRRQYSLPAEYRVTREPRSVIRAAAGIRGLRNSIGYLCLFDGEAIFFTRRMFRQREHRLKFEGTPEFRKGILLDRLVFRTTEGEQRFLVFKGQGLGVGGREAGVGRQEAGVGDWRLGVGEK